MMETTYRKKQVRLEEKKQEAQNSTCYRCWSLRSDQFTDDLLDPKVTQALEGMPLKLAPIET